MRPRSPAVRAGMAAEFLPGDISGVDPLEVVGDQLDTDGEPDAFLGQGRGDVCRLSGKADLGGVGLGRVYHRCKGLSIPNDMR